MCCQYTIKGLTPFFSSSPYKGVDPFYFYQEARELRKGIVEEKKKILIKRLLKLSLITVIILLTVYAVVEILRLKSALESDSKGRLPEFSEIK